MRRDVWLAAVLVCRAIDLGTWLGAIGVVSRRRGAKVGRVPVVKGKSMGFIVSAHRVAWIRLVCLILPSILWGAAASGQKAPDAPRLSFSVDDHRPLAALADELEKRDRIVITYEDAPWVAPTDLEDVTRAVTESNPGKVAPSVPVIVPRKAAVSFEYDLDPVKDHPIDYADLLSALLLQFEAAGAPGKFRFEGDDGIYHLIPSRLRDPEGHWTDVSPVLSTPVRIANQERTVDETLNEIVAQLNETSPVKVGWGFVPLNLFVQTHIRLGADGVPAREVMRQILALLPRPVTWRLNYDPTSKRYYLNFLLRSGSRSDLVDPPRASAPEPSQ